MAVIKFSEKSLVKSTYKGYRTLLSKLVKTCKIVGGAFGLVLEDGDKPYLHILTRISNPKSLAKQMQGMKLVLVHRNIFELESGLVVHYTDISNKKNEFRWTRTRPDSYLTREQMVMYDVYTDLYGRTLESGKIAGITFNRLCKECAGEPEEIVKALDTLIRSGMVVKLPTGGLWLTEAYWQKVLQTDSMVWLSPGYHIRDGKAVSKRKIYGKNKRSNFAPAKMGCK